MLKWFLEGDDADLSPLDRISTDGLHIMLAPILLVFVAPWALGLWVLAAGGKQVADYASARRDPRPGARADAAFDLRRIAAGAVIAGALWWHLGAPWDQIHAGPLTLAALAVALVWAQTIWTRAAQDKRAAP